MFKNHFKKFYKLYVDKIGNYYLQNDYLNPQKNFRLLSKVLVKIFNVENHTF